MQLASLPISDPTSHLPLTFRDILNPTSHTYSPSLDDRHRFVFTRLSTSSKPQFGQRQEGVEKGLGGDRKGKRKAVKDESQESVITTRSTTSTRGKTNRTNDKVVGNAGETSRRRSTRLAQTTGGRDICWIPCWILTDVWCG